MSHDEQHAPTAVGVSAPSRLGTVIWLTIAAAIAPVFLFWFFPVVGLGAIAGVIGVVLVLRARARGDRTRFGVVALLVSAVAAIVDVILVVCALTLLNGTQLHQFEVRATGGPSFTVDLVYADGTQRLTEEWSSAGWKRFATAEASTEILVTGDGALSCEILMDGQVVDTQTSTGGSVTCRHE